VLKPSTIEGIGLFAAEFIHKSTPVWRFMPGFDQMLPPSFISDIYDREYLDRYAQQCPWTKCWILCADDMRFCNHSNHPNVNVIAPLFDPHLSHDALYDIQPGEELTCDYTIGDLHPFYGFDHATLVQPTTRR
jgi:hypothetical protein